MHKGHYVHELPEAYLNWLMLNAIDTMPPGLRRAVEQALSGDRKPDQDGKHDPDHGSNGHRPRHGAGRAATGPSDYAGFLSSEMAAGGWAPSFRSWCLALGQEAADTLSHILTLAKMKADRDGWAVLSPNYLTSGIGLTEASQVQVLDRLEQLGIVEIAYRDTTRYVCICTARIQEIVAQAD
jgi:hypothetical protein